MKSRIRALYCRNKPCAVVLAIAIVIAAVLSALLVAHVISLQAAVPHLWWMALISVVCVAVMAISPAKQPNRVKSLTKAHKATQAKRSTASTSPKPHHIVKAVIIYLICIAIGIVTSFLVTNYKNLVSGVEHSVITPRYTTQTIKSPKAVDDSGLITVISLANQDYIGRLRFNYETSSQSYNWGIDYQYTTVTGKTSSQHIDGANSGFTHLFVEKINSNATNFTLSIYSSDVQISDLAIDNSLSFFNWQLVFFFTLAIILATFIVFRQKFINRPERLFLLLALGFGLAMIFSQPLGINRSWDDEIHFDRAYRAVHQDSSEAAEVYQDPFYQRYATFNTEEESYDYAQQLDQLPSSSKLWLNTEYSNLSYLGIIFGELIGTIFHLSFSTTIFVALVFSLLAYVGAMFFAIKKTPVGKYVLLTIGLIPVSLFMSSNFSYDPLLTAFMMLGFSYFLATYLDRQSKLTTRDTIIMLGAFIIALAAKPQYAIFLLVLLCLPKEKFSSVKSRRVFKAATIILTLLIFFSNIISTATAGATFSDARGGDTDVIQQLSSVKNHPASVAVIFHSTAQVAADRMIGSGIFQNLAYLNPPSNLNSYFLSIFLLVLAIIISCNQTIDKKLKKALLAICAALVLMIWGTLFLVFTEVGATTIEGVQSRYFIPLLFPLALVLATSKIKANIKPSTINWIFFALEFYLLANVVYSIFY